VSALVRVFVNEHAVEIPEGCGALAAVRAFDPVLAQRLAERSAYLTDARGIRLPDDALLVPGSIVRVVLSRRGAAGADVDA